METLFYHLLITMIKAKIAQWCYPSVFCVTTRETRDISYNVGCCSFSRCLSKRVCIEVLWSDGAGISASSECDGRALAVAWWEPRSKATAGSLLWC